MALSAGDHLGLYEILEPLGAGGMGEVYRAHDTKLDRDVALKVLSEGSLGDEDARGRFRREANALSRLSHPHIATIFDFDTSNGADFLVMELVRGPSLRDELEEKGALPERKSISLGAQLARGLQAAHEQGIVHRDLKPSNLQLTPDGLLKILDFGLARLLPREPAPGEATAPTQTAVGTVAGTPLYMAPEQLRGRGVDARTDLYAAGAVLYESATGKRLFSRPSAAELTDAILHEEPTPPRALNEGVSARLEAVILKALDKDPELRHQTARDLLVDLERLQLRPDSRPSGGPTRGVSTDSRAAAPEEKAPAPRARSWRRAAVLVLVVAAVAGAAWLARPAPSPRVTAIHPLLRQRGAWVTSDGARVYQVVTRQGQKILQRVPIAGGDLAETPLPFPGEVRLLDAFPGESALLVASSREEPAADEASEGDPLWRLPVPAGIPQRLGSLRARGASVSPDGRSLALIRGRSLVLASIDGSSPRELLRAEQGLSRVRWSPDGRRLRYTSTGPETENESWIWEIPAAGGAPRPLWPGHVGGWTGDGRFYIFDRPPTHDLFVAKEHLWTRWWPGTPEQLTSGRGSFQFHGSSSDGDRLIVSTNASGGRGTLLRYDPERKAFEPILGGESAFYAEPSPDGEWLAWVRYPEGTLWRSRPDGSDRLQLTSPPTVAHLPRWSPDGTRLVFLSQPDPSTPREIRVVAADGSEGALWLRPGPSEEGYGDACWQPDGSIILGRIAASGLFRYDPSTRRVEPVPGGDRLRAPKCSPHGDVWASPGHLRLRGAAEWRSLGFVGEYPNWTRDGGSICGLTRDSQVMCLKIADGQTTTVADASAVGLAAWRGTPWMGLDAQDRPMVVTSEGAANVHVLYWETL